MTTGPGFFVVSGAILVLAGVAQAFLRPSRADEATLEKLFNRSTVWAVLCAAVGLAGILLGLGLLPGVRLRGGP